MSHHRSALILQVVGYQNSGKTSFVSELTKQLSSAGRRVGVIKHHGHGGALDLPMSDSHRHALAGAVLSSVIGEDGTFIEWQAVDTFELLLNWYEAHVDIVLIEGYKRKDYPKIVLVRDGQEQPIDLTNVIARGDSVTDRARLMRAVERWMGDEMVRSK
ncbi:molybdopterin-guanine dinucleotide biosynthesis protein B [Exiguobacterium aurantiacum]|uniref:Molybdopterin-guanine dinucleotide biosynthesis protein B n=1 Tax=Exiguobacterium aurantiacum TaxID=33987 RepID=A0A377FXE6_9BACL|nr:molybdopterin-guanine dinucleotide biosynthesis protein B [Exiguobacterium aurantiacum]STO09467.1 Molybdopterin-guanine dinucleotide biosynthesis protein B [Exiguobacterium aurantiacum]